MNKVFSKRTLVTLLVLSCGLGLNACVTTTTSGGIQVNEEKALETHIRAGMAYLQQDNRDAARRHFESALELDDDSAEAWQGIGILHQLNGEPELAERAFKKSLRGDASISVSSGHLAYGRFLYEQERYGEAYEHFETAANNVSYPSRSTALVYVGRAAQKLGRSKRAVAAFEHAVKLDRRQADALIELADYYFSERNYPQAKAYLDRFAQVTQHTPRSLWLGIRIERVFGNKNREASYALMLKNMHPYSKEYLEYKRLIAQ